MKDFFNLLPTDAGTTLMGRGMLAGVFVIAGAGKLLDLPGTEAYMASQGIPPLVVPVLLGTTIAIELGGGMALLLGYQGVLAALVLTTFLIPVTLIFHPFWFLTGVERQLQLVHFLKNVAIMGGLLTIAVHGTGALSLDRRKRRLAAAILDPADAPS